MTEWSKADLDEAGVGRLASALALKIKAGDCIALHGDLGAGKTTFARAFIRAVLADPHAEVPSPTFGIEQIYECPRLTIAHYDLYRLSGPDELEDIGFEERASGAVTLVEWPERAGALLPDTRVDVFMGDAAGIGHRTIRLVSAGAISVRMDRATAIFQFLESQPRWRDAQLTYLNGDASTRAYARLRDAVGTAVLMDAPKQADGPPLRDGRPYSRIAHLAEDVRPFVAVLGGLQRAGLAAPNLIAHDLEQGLLLTSDLGDLYFGKALRELHDQGELWAAAIDVLIALRRRPFPNVLPLPDGATHTLPRFDRAALEIEVDLLLDWYWPYAKGAPVSAAVRATFKALWSPILDRMLAEPPGLFLRDYHSPNLFWRPEQLGTDRVGVIDFQDALAEPWAYDVVSLLQDARVDVPRSLESREQRRYMTTVAAFEPTFDGDAFTATYAAFGAQRNTRLIGLWVRLLQRDGKAHYMQHMARTWDYLARNLAHPTLAPLAAWYGEHFPQDKHGASVRG